MRSEEEIRLLRNEVKGWVDMILEMEGSRREPLVIAALVMVYDVLDWTMQDASRIPEFGCTFGTTMRAFRVTFEEIKKKQDKHRSALAN